MRWRAGGQRIMAARARSKKIHKVSKARVSTKHPKKIRKASRARPSAKHPKKIRKASLTHLKLPRTVTAAFGRLPADAKPYSEALQKIGARVFIGRAGTSLRLCVQLASGLDSIQSRIGADLAANFIDLYAGRPGRAVVTWHLPSREIESGEVGAPQFRSTFSFESAREAARDFESRTERDDLLLQVLARAREVAASRGTLVADALHSERSAVQRSKNREIEGGGADEFDVDLDVDIYDSIDDEGEKYGTAIDGPPAGVRITFFARG